MRIKHVSEVPAFLYVDNIFLFNPFNLRLSNLIFKTILEK